MLQERAQGKPEYQLGLEFKAALASKDRELRAIEKVKKRVFLGVMGGPRVPSVRTRSCGRKGDGRKQLAAAVRGY